MSPVLRYALTAVLVVGAGSAVLAALLGESARTGVLLAAAIALPVQVVAFGLMARARGEFMAFFLWWGAGVAARVIVVAVVGLASAGFNPDGRAALVLTLVGFFFVLLLLEPVFLKGEPKSVKKTA